MMACVAAEDVLLVILHGCAPQERLTPEDAAFCVDRGANDT